MKTIISSSGAIFVALLASTCCVGPLMALAGMLGATVSQLVWLATIKPYLISFSLLAIGYNLYRAYYPKKVKTCCSLEEQEALQKVNQKEYKVILFLQSKKFLWSVAILTIIILLIPYLLNL